MLRSILAWSTVAISAIALGQQECLAQPTPDIEYSMDLPLQGGVAPERNTTYGYVEKPTTSSGVYRWSRQPGAPTPPLLAYGANIHYPGVNVTVNTYDGASSWNLNWLDRGVALHGIVPTIYAQGGRLGINLFTSPSPGDFLCPSPTLEGGSFCLLPPGSAQSGTSWQGAKRATLEQVVDLATGLPLLQVTDLELPFDGAVFRLNRTRSANHPANTGSGQYSGGGSGVRDLPGPERWWDWVGHGWMASENPILLIDCGVADLVGRRARTTWLWLDAHHSIPFQQVNHQPSGGGPPVTTYEAPPRFRARITHNGVRAIPQPTSVPGEDPGPFWAQPPTQYDVWLYDGALRYTFVIVYEDVPANIWDERHLQGQPTGSATPADFAQTHLHRLPLLPDYYLPDTNHTNMYHDPFYARTNPGLGVPFYGLLVKVEDSHGHSVEIDYCKVRRIPLPHNSTLFGNDKFECFEDSQAKGQIRSVKLRTRTGSTVETRWTLLYAHRRVPGYRFPTFIRDSYPPASYPELYELHGYSAIDRIYVFVGDIPEGQLESAELITRGDISTASAAGEPGVLGWGTVDPLTVYNANPPNGQAPIRADWSYQVRYHYAATQPEIDLNNLPATPGIIVHSPPLLLKTSLWTRPSPVNTSPAAPATGDQVRTRVFVHSPPDGSVPFATPAQIPWIEMIFEEEDLAQLLSERTELGMPDLTADMVAQWLQPGQLFPEPLNESARSYASLRLVAATSSTWDDGDAQRFPPSQALLTAPEGYLRVDSPEVWSDGHPGATVALAVIGNSASGQRRFRVHRLMVPADPQGGFQTSSQIATSRGPRRSIFVHPFAWWGFMDNVAGQTFQMAEAYTQWPDGPDLSKARWISIIDEFPAEARSAGQAGQGSTYQEETISYNSTSTIKEGQLSRWVVQMNPSGYVLRERKWEFTPAGIVASGSGLGEQYVYKKISQLGFTGPGIPQNVKDEVVLAEHRSVGWSVADLQNLNANPPIFTGATTEGLVRFFTYDVILESATTAGGQTSYRARVVSLSNGIQKGAETPQAAATRMHSSKRFELFDTSIKETDIELRFATPVSDTQLASIHAPSQLTLQYLQQDAGSPLAGVQAIATVTITTRAADGTDPNVDPSVPLRERRVLTRQVIGPPRQLRPGGELYFPIEKEWYDENGNTEWSASGLVRNPLDPLGGSTGGVALDSLILTYNQRYEGTGWGSGQIAHAVIDAVPDAAPAGPLPTPSGWEGIPVVIPDWREPGKWERIPQERPTRYLTSFKYDMYGPTDICFPTGRRWARRFVSIEPPLLVAEGIITQAESEDLPPWVLRRYVFNDLEFSTAAGTWVSASPGEIVDYASNEPKGQLAKRRVTFGPLSTTVYQQPAYPSELPSFEPMQQERYGFDYSGRARKADLLEWVPSTGWAAIGSKEINDLGEVYRELEMDGSITRITRNFLGQSLRKYTGTRDEDWVNQGQGQDPETYNMVLVERTSYGLSVNDAWQPTVVRQYRSNPAWATDHYGQAASPDLQGIATVTGYDWRMRPVRVDTFSQGDPVNPGSSPPERLTTTLTYLDHLNRPALVATFGRGNLDWIASSLDPRTFAPAQAPPGASALLSGTLAPISLVAYLYGPDGDVQERRDYDVSGSGSAFHSEYHFTGRGGTEVFSQAPGRPATRSELDGQGRVAWTAAIAPGISAAPDRYRYELTRTDFTYDRFGSVIEVAQWERVSDSGDVLDVTNAVRSRSVSWYDHNRRVIATADLGTEQPTFTSGSPQYVRVTFGAIPEQDVHAIAPHLANGVVEREGLPLEAMISLYAYDNKGNMTQSVDSRGAVTRSSFTSLGKLKSQTENYVDPDPAKRRLTTYGYELGRLVRVIANRTSSQSQTTELIYGADVVDAGFNTVSRSNQLVGRMWLPDPLNGIFEPRNSPDLTLRYTFQGRIAERIDPRGVVFRYTYDDLGRLSNVLVGRYQSESFIAEYPPSMTPASGTPADRAGIVEYQYNEEGRLKQVTAKAEASSTAPIIAQTFFDYDSRGNLEADFQAHGAAVQTASTPKTAYLWDYTATGAPGSWVLGHTRLGRITYPAQSGLPERILDLEYGSAPGVLNEQLSRLTTIKTKLINETAASQPIADFGYTGGSRRISLAWGNGKVLQDWTLNQTGLMGLDTFGRPRDLRVTNAGAGDVLFEAIYGYDEAGNRKTSRLTQAGGASYANARSQLNGYDLLGRLESTEVGALNAGSTALEQGSLFRSDLWSLDLLGNWVGAQSTAGRQSAGNLDGYGSPWIQPNADAAPDQENLTHTINQRNQITASTDSGGPDPVFYDAAGNLAFDGSFFYQYDAWNRLLQINQATLGAGGGLQDVVPGAFVKSYSYDGLGRLIRTLSAYPAPPTLSTLRRSERFYYDGIRRLQEVVLDPVASTKTADDSGDPELIALEAANNPETTPDEDTATLAFEKGQEDDVGGGIPIQPQSSLIREYVWGRGDNRPDELLVQYAPGAQGARTPWWVVQDAGGDVVALCDSGATGGNGRVVAQWTYDAYGQPLTTEHFYPHPYVHCGHKALFLDRLDIGVVNSGGADNARITPFAHLLCHVRNRVYQPHSGGWNQADPNATGSVLLSNAAFHGTALNLHVDQLDLQARYDNGPNTYQYLGSNPWTKSDPMGLFFGYDDLAQVFVGAMRGGLEEMVTQYAVNMEGDAEWSSDWEMNDDWHTRGDNSWVELSFILGFYRGMMEQVKDIFYVDEMSELVQANSRFGQRIIRVGGVVGNFAARLHIRVPSGNYYVKSYRVTGRSHKFVIFSENAIKYPSGKPMRITPQGNSAADIAEANRRCGKPRDYDWSAEYGAPHTWHHDHVRGRMYLVPRDLHDVVKPHIGGAKTWYE
jgi:YD repeat-containing protein